MLGKEKFYRFNLIEKKKFFLKILITYCLFTNVLYADIQKQIINKITSIKTLSFNFKQQIDGGKESGKCIIKYPLLMKCDYNNLKQKVIITNGKTVAIIKKKYKRIYLYPIKTTPLFKILKKEEIFNLIRNSKPTKENTDLITFTALVGKNNILKVLFDEKSLELKGWQTTDAYSNNVSFMISDLIINQKIEDDIFKIPQESDL
ncbi:MAG: Outer membrane lipoprotein-sorting protein [Pelagibacterales bacterium]|nr:Outer membrane lipoprotein-sorting protein [Pelagibacterales bacterium]